jgi:hypothetical protein
MRSWLRAASCALLGLASAPLPAQAGDGRLEIHAACVAAGCFAGDAPGFPVETSAGQSYVLTSNLAVPNANTTGVELAARAVLDLNGFAIEGTTSCSGIPVVCTGTGTGDGVMAEGDATVRNGTVRRMGRWGIYGQGIRVEGVLVEQNGDDGIRSGGSAEVGASLIRDCRVQHNGNDGLDFAWGHGGQGSQVIGNVFFQNGRHGVVGGQMSLIQNVADENVEEGFNLSYGSTGMAFNTLVNNNGGAANAQIVGSNGHAMGGNVCGGDTVCP